MRSHNKNRVANEVMVVDDKPENLSILTEMLEAKGYGVRAYINGELALASARYKQPSIVLLDIDMPVVDGFELCQKFKAEKKLSDVPILFLSAYTDTEIKVKGFKLGAVDYISKPFDSDEVLVRIDTHLKMQDYKMQLEESLNRLQKLEKIRDDLIHMIAHDMRSPLACINGYVDILQESYMDNMDSDGRKYL